MTINSRPMNISKDRSRSKQSREQLGERPVGIHSGERRLIDPTGTANCLISDLDGLRDIDDILCDSDIDDFTIVAFPSASALALMY
jgi:hypothetical protein